ncbi:MAG: hypothetical protein EOM28_12205 [Clostridia bacterium]|nr:hypothetical protein [Clostridia bacterium]
MLEDILKKYGGVEVSAMDVYSDIFHLGENEIQKRNEEKGTYKSNPLGYWKNDKDSKGHYRILFDDTFEETLKELQEADFCIMNGISYFGRKNVQEHASKMYAMIFDLDGVTDETLGNFLHSCFSDFTIYPLPNYIILSGHGVHLYYVFEYPIPLYPNIKIQLKELKYSLTTKMWNRYTTKHWEKVQYQGINQGFRVIGGKTKIEGVRVRAFSLNSHPYCLEQLNQYVPEDKRIDETKLWKESKLTLTQAKKKYPEWYQKRVVRGEKQGTWTCKEDLYHWWIRKIQEGASVGHRYFCVMCLAIYGVKSGISKKQVEKDAIELIPFLNGMSDTEPFTESDVKSALECFDERYMTFPIEDISKISGISIEKNKRNGRKQGLHLKMARSNLAIMNEDIGSSLQGRPEGTGTKKEIIAEWQKCHPEGKKINCHKDTGLSRMTIDKWWTVKGQGEADTP